ncbi:MAG: YitT family protein, partial [Firmicutes bacterium]|nr:YitT family protein [Bacillota bacterium]
MTPTVAVRIPGWRVWGPFALIAAGTAVTALGIDVFYAPNRISDGGVAGVGIILLYLLHLPVW